MVDRDKIKDRTSGKDDSNNKKRSKSRSSGSSSTSDSSGDIELDDNVGGDTYSDKMEKLKGTSGSSSSSSNSGGSDKVPRAEAGSVLEAIANILFYTEGKMRSYKKPSSKREVVETNVTTKIYEQFTEFVAVCNVQAICEKYGIDWEEDVLQQVIAEQDFENAGEGAHDVTADVANVGSGAKFDKKHFHQLLIALGRMYLFSKMLEDKHCGSDDPEDKMACDPIKDISAKCIDFMGSFNVEEVAKKNGISFQHDVIQRMAEEGQ